MAERGAFLCAIRVKSRLDPPSKDFYGEIAWTYRWMHDRAWQENPIFGKVRYTSYARRFDVKINIANWLTNRVAVFREAKL